MSTLPSPPTPLLEGEGSPAPPSLRGKGVGGLGPWPLAPLGIVAAILLAAWLVPGTLKYKLDFLGFGVCHQIASHTLFLGGHQLPLCARCSGIYLGALTTLLL